MSKKSTPQKQEVYKPKDVQIGKKFGGVTPEKFSSYEELYDKFETEWQKIAIDFVNGNL